MNGDDGELDICIGESSDVKSVWGRKNIKKKNTIKPEQLSNLRRPTEEEKQQIKGCLETYFNKANRIGNRVRVIFIVLAFIFLLNCINAGKGAIVYILFSMIMFAVWWVLGRSKKDGILCWYMARGKRSAVSSVLARIVSHRRRRLHPTGASRGDTHGRTALYRR